MIAWAGVELFRLGRRDGLDLAARARWPLDRRAPEIRGGLRGTGGRAGGLAGAVRGPIRRVAGSKRCGQQVGEIPRGTPRTLDSVGRRCGQGALMAYYLAVSESGSRLAAGVGRGIQYGALELDLDRMPELRDFIERFLS